MRQNRDEKIRLYERRSLTGKVNTVFDFIHVNWRPWLRLTVYVLLPISIVAGMGLVDFMAHHVFHDHGGDWVASAIMVYGLMAVGYMMANCLCLSLMKCYFDRPDGLETVTFGDLWRCLRAVAWPMIVISVLLFVVALPMSWLTMFAFLLMPFAFLFYCAGVVNPLLMAAPVAVFEGCGVKEAIVRGFRLCYAQFWKMVGLMIVMLLIYFYSQLFFSGVWALLSMILNAFVGGRIEITGDEVFLTAAYYVATIAMTLVQYYAYSVLVMAIALHYGSVAQEKDDADLETEIDNFANL